MEEGKYAVRLSDYCCKLLIIEVFTERGIATASESRFNIPTRAVSGRASAGRGLVRGARNTLPLGSKRACDIGRNDENEYGRGPPKRLGNYRPKTRKPF